MNFNRTKVDEFLNDALRNYSDAEPRIGFESRILANLRTAPAQSWWHRKFMYASVAAVLVCVIGYGVWRLGAMLLSPRPASPKVLANRVPAPEVVSSNQQTVSSAPTRQRALKRVHNAQMEREHQDAALASRLPAPLPLSQQEKVLLAFARDNPKEIEASVAWQERMRQPPEAPDLPNRGEQ